MGEGLLQTHGMASNTKQDGIFRIMGKNCNGLNNRIGGNGKIGKIMDIKEDLDIDKRYCDWQSLHTTFTRQNMQEESRREALAQYVLASQQDTSLKQDKTRKA